MSMVPICMYSGLGVEFDAEFVGLLLDFPGLVDLAVVGEQASARRRSGPPSDLGDQALEVVLGGEGNGGFLPRWSKVLLNRASAMSAQAIGRAVEVGAPGQLAGPAAADGVEAGHVVAQDQVELQLFFQLGLLQLGQLGRLVLAGVGEDVLALGADRFDVGVDLALPLHLGDPVVEFFQLVLVVALVGVDHVGEELHRLAGRFDAEVLAGGVHVVEGGFHLHRVGVGAEDALAAQPGGGGHGPDQVDDLALGSSCRSRGLGRPRACCR